MIFIKRKLTFAGIGEAKHAWFAFPLLVVCLSFLTACTTAQKAPADQSTISGADVKPPDISGYVDTAPKGVTKQARDTSMTNINKPAISDIEDGKSVKANGEAADPQKLDGLSEKCAALTANIDTTLEETVRAGCTPTLAQISELMNNPIGNLVLLPLQYDHIEMRGPNTGGSRYVDRLQFIPTFPVSISENWNLVNRLNFQFLGVPVNRNVGNLFGASMDDITVRPDLASTLADPWGNTTGFSDFVYLPLLAPKKTMKMGDGNFIWAVGPSFIFPTASEKVLGQGKYQAGPAGILGYLGEKWRLGVLPQNWWSYAGDSDRSSTNQFNMQYFVYYAPSPTWSIGAMPHITCNWMASSGNKCTLPIGVGVNTTQNIGKLPVRMGIEAYYSALNPDDSLGSRWNLRIFFIPVIPTFMF